MAVPLPIGIRNTKSGIQKNVRTARIPTGPSQIVGVPRDPGVAGGPGNVPLGAFGTGGSSDAGAALQSVGIELTEDIVKGQRAADAAALREQLQAEEVEIGAVLKESNAKLDNLSGKVQTRLHSGPGLSPVDQYRQDTQKLMDEQMSAVDNMQMSPGSKLKLERQLLGQVNVHNSAVAKSMQDLKKKEFEDFVGRSYVSAQGRHKNDIVGWLEENEKIDADTRLLLGDETANAMFKTANETAVLSKYETLLGTGFFDRAEDALNDPATRHYLSQETLRAKFKELLEGRIQAKVNAEVLAKTKESGRYQNLTNGSLWDNIEREVVPGTDDPSKGVINTPAGAFQWVRDTEDKTKGTWEIIPGSKPAVAQTDQEKRDDIEDNLKRLGVLITPDVINRIYDLEPKAQSEFMEKLEAIHKLNTTDEMKEAIRESVITGVKPSDFDKQENLIKSLNLSPELEQKALLSLGTGKADLRSPQEKGLDAGTEEAYKNIQQRLIEDTAGYTEPFKVDSGATNSIRVLAERYVEYVRQDGRVKLLDGGAEMLGKLVNNAEQLLRDGEANSIGQAVFLAYHAIPVGDRPVVITGLSQVQDMLKESGNVGAVIPDKTVIKDANSVVAANPQLREDIENLDLTQTFIIDGIPQSLNIKQATGIKSALQALAGATVAQVPGLEFLENKEVTQARLMFSLIARDVVRLISLSPRFAVKEQQLIQSMFPGPELFNSPRQALNKIKTMQAVIDSKLVKIQRDLKRTNIDFETESRLVGEASGLIEIKGRMSMFTFDHLIPIEKVQTAASVKQLGSKRALQFSKSLSPLERRSLPTPVLRELAKYKRARKKKQNAGKK